MNRTAKCARMTKHHFKNAHGLEQSPATNVYRDET